MKKIGYVMPISDFELALAEGFEQKGHYEPVEWPEGTAAELREARALLKAVEANRHIQRDIDGSYYVEEPARRKWVADETDEEWLNRWKEAR